MSVVDQAVVAIQLRIAMGGIMIAILMAAISLWISRRITRPLEHLRIGAKRFARGNLTHKLPLTGSQEISDLAEALNQMAAELDEKIRDIVEQRNEREAILSSMIEGVLAVDTQERLIRLNQTAARLIGVDPARAQGRMLQEVVRNLDLQQLVANVLATQKPQEDEILLHDNGGGERYLHAHGTILRDSQEKETGALVVLHEVTRLEKTGKSPPRFRRQCFARASNARDFDQRICGNAAGRSDEQSRGIAAIPANRGDSNRPAERHYRGFADAVAHRTRNGKGGNRSCSGFDQEAF